MAIFRNLSSGNDGHHREKNAVTSCGMTAINLQNFADLHVGRWPIDDFPNFFFIITFFFTLGPLKVPTKLIFRSEIILTLEFNHFSNVKSVFRHTIVTNNTYIVEPLNLYIH